MGVFYKFYFYKYTVKKGKSFIVGYPHFVHPIKNSPNKKKNGICEPKNINKKN